MKIPDDWPLAKLSKVVIDMQPGFAQRPSYKQVGTPQLRTNHVTPDGEIDLSALVYVHTSADDLTKYGIKRGDVIFNNTNSIEWVGKTAYFDHDGDYVLSNHMTRIRVDERIIDAEFLARYLHYLWLNGVSRRWAKHWVNQAAIDQNALSNFHVLLPPLSEQHCIASILHEAGKLRQLRREADEKSNDLLQSLFNEMFGPASKTRFSTKRLGDFAETKYGTSDRASETPSDGVPVLRIPNIISGQIDYSDLKYVLLPGNERKALRLKDSDILVVRTNGNPDYVGRCSHYEDDGVERVFASYLIRVRLDTGIALPEYLSDFLRSEKGRRMIQGRVRTSAGQYNLNSESISAFDIPIPDFDKQKLYVERRKGIIAHLSQSKDCAALLNDLNQSLLAKAFAGELTAGWREQNLTTLAEEAAERDRLLHQPIQPKRISPAIREFVPPTEAATRLSAKQHRALTLVETQDGYFTAERLSTQFESEERLALPDAQQTLELLVELGLLAGMRVTAYPERGKGLFSRAYRRLREEDNSRLADVSVLEAPGQ
jgi:type I restriction enzyme, S subunit